METNSAPLRFLVQSTKNFMPFISTVSRTAEWHPVARKNLYILDSSTISLFKAILKPAGRKRKDGTSKGGMKVHTLLNADANMPSFIKYTAAALHDQLKARMYLKYDSR